MPIGIKPIYQDKIMRDKKKKMALDKEAQYKSMGGNVSSYYNKGGKVAGCAPAMNNPMKNK